MYVKQLRFSRHCYKICNQAVTRFCTNSVGKRTGQWVTERYVDTSAEDGRPHS